MDERTLNLPRPRFAWTLIGAIASGASAHPIDEVVQSSYLTLARGEIRLELELIPGTQVAGALLPLLDLNNDQIIADAEARLFAQQVLGRMALSLNGRTARWRLQRVSAPPYGNLLLAGDVVKIYAVARRADRPGRSELVYQNNYRPANSRYAANVFLRSGGSWRYRVTAQRRSDDGRLLVVRYTAVPR